MYSSTDLKLIFATACPHYQPVMEARATMGL
jgi:hypothetical protein